LTPTYSEVIYETQPSLVVHEHTGPRRLFEAAGDLHRPCRFRHHDSSSPGGFFQLDVELEHAARRSVQPVHDSAAGFEQRLGDAAPG
jgi:hypothetical protein